MDKDFILLFGKRVLLFGQNAAFIGTFQCLDKGNRNTFRDFFCVAL